MMVARKKTPGQLQRDAERRYQLQEKKREERYEAWSACKSEIDHMTRQAEWNLGEVLDQFKRHRLWKSGGYSSFEDWAQKAYDLGREKASRLAQLHRYSNWPDYRFFGYESLLIYLAAEPHVKGLIREAVSKGATTSELKVMFEGEFQRVGRGNGGIPRLI